MEYSDLQVCEMKERRTKEKRSRKRQSIRMKSTKGETGEAAKVGRTPSWVKSQID